MSPHDPHVRIFAESERRTNGAYFWDCLRDELPAWNDLTYEWIASSSFGDQIILTNNSPIHLGPAIYMHGPDVGGPISENPNWPSSILYLGATVDEWLARIARFGDEYSVVPGCIDEFVDDSDAYRKIYRELNPGLTW
jgi:hypothetical protein